MGSPVLFLKLLEMTLKLRHGPVRSPVFTLFHSCNIICPTFSLQKTVRESSERGREDTSCKPLSLSPSRRLVSVHKGDHFPPLLTQQFPHNSSELTSQLKRKKKEDDESAGEGPAGGPPPPQPADDGGVVPPPTPHSCQQGNNNC